MDYAAVGIGDARFSPRMDAPAVREACRDAVQGPCVQMCPHPTMKAAGRVGTAACILLAAAAAVAEDRLYTGTGTVAYTVQCGTTVHSVTGFAQVSILATNDPVTGGFWGEIKNPYMFRFPRNPATDPIVATLEPILFERGHAFHCSPEAVITMADAATLICPPVGDQTHLVGGGFSEDGGGTPFDWLMVNVITHCTGNTCTGSAGSVKTTVKWEFRDIPAIAPTVTVFSARVQDTHGNPVTEASFAMAYAPGFQRAEGDFPPVDYPPRIWDYERFVPVDGEGRFTAKVLGYGPIRVMSCYLSEYNGFSQIFHTPESDAVITLIPTNEASFTCVQYVSGDVRAREYAGGQWSSWFGISSGMRLHAPWHVMVHEDSGCIIHLNGKGRVILKELSEIRALDEQSPSLLELIRGVLGISTTDSKYQLKTSAGFVGVRSTGFRVAATNGVHVVDTAHGVVTFSPADGGPPRDVAPGRRLRIDGAGMHMENLSSNEWAELQEEVEALGWPMEPSLHTDFGDGRMPPWMSDRHGSWGVTASNALRNVGFRADDFPFALLDYECADAVLQADIRKVAGDAAGYAYSYGLHLRSDGVENSFYEFAITKSGSYMIGKYVNGGWWTLVNWRPTDALRTGFHAWNTLKAVARGTNLSFYANGRLLETIGDSSLTRGRFGFFSTDAAASASADVVEFDNVVLAPDSPNRGDHTPVIFDQQRLAGGGQRLSWSSQPADWFTLVGSTNLMSGSGIVTQNIRGEFPVTSCTSAPPSDRAVFYWLRRQ